MTKKIEAIIREDKFGDVKEALRKIGIVGMNVTEVRGHGRQGGISLTGRAGEYHVDLLPRHQFNIVLSDHNVERTVEAILQAARTGNTGDGMIFIYPVEDVIRVRTGERGHQALMYEGDIDTRLTPCDEFVELQGAAIPAQTAVRLEESALARRQPGGAPTSR